ncbi:MAG: ribonuclease D [Pseudomonadota bacterium]|nr:ribonuclease D [Pseudomonadota bacterium]
MPYTLINTPDALAAAAERWVRSEFLAVDTEFIRVDTYYPQLCLVQIRDQQESSLVDTIALNDLTPLLDALYTPGVIKLFHAAGQDLEILVRLRGRCPQPLFDAQIAATLLGIGDQIGYAGLIDKRLGITLDKSLSRTNWARRPLTGPEMDYAAADVEYLAQIYPELQAMLVERGRLAWMAEDCARLCESDQYVTLPHDAWQRLRILSRLNAREQTVAAALAAWRETEAQERDRPRKWILDDEPLYRLAQRRPGTEAELSALNVLPPKTLARHTTALLACIAAALEQPERRLVVDDELDASAKVRLKALQAVVQDRAQALDLPVGYLAPRADLIRLLRLGAQANANVLRGWRREVCGEALLAAL